MKIQLTEPGYEQFTGHFGVVEFLDGTSVGDVSQGEAALLASLVQVRTIDGVNPSPAQAILDSYGDQLAAATQPTVAELPPEPVAERRAYTMEELAEAADKGGIKAVRAIADPLGIKGQSIAEIIGKIVAANPVDAPAAEPAAE